SQGEVLEVRADAVISPANSCGFMDGGIDLVYSQRFGWGLQRDLQKAICTYWDGELPVGAALIVETRDELIPYVVSAPTMRVPLSVPDTVNAYLAFRAALLAIDRHNRGALNKIESVLCPGLATAIGEMPASVCAQQMRNAYDRWTQDPAWFPESIREAKEDHHQQVISSN
ncbi:unnamed protein product, partial [Ectocarpus sp. 4 AP-2014]